MGGSQGSEDVEPEKVMCHEKNHHHVEGSIGNMILNECYIKIGKRVA